MCVATRLAVLPYFRSLSFPPQLVVQAIAGVVTGRFVLPKWLIAMALIASGWSLVERPPLNARRRRLAGLTRRPCRSAG
jgi:hypothetical protein